MKTHIVIGVLSILLYVFLVAGSLFAWIGPTYRYQPGHYYHGGFWYWGNPGYNPGHSPGALGGGRARSGSFSGGGAGIGK